MKKVDLKKLDELRILPATLMRYRSIVACYKLEMRKGETKAQSIYNTSYAKGTSECNVYRAIKAVAQFD